MELLFFKTHIIEQLVVIFSGLLFPLVHRRNIGILNGNHDARIKDQYDRKDDVKNRHLSYPLRFFAEDVPDILPFLRIKPRGGFIFF